MPPMPAARGRRARFPVCGAESIGRREQRSAIMSHRKTRREPTFERERTYDEEPQYTWMVYGIGMILVGALAGYILSVSTGRAPLAASAPVAAATGTADAHMVDEVALKAYRDILARDPKNVQAAVNAGNMLYDAKRYEEAIPYYQQAMAANGSDANVSTDLGTALWYTGRPDAAIAQYSVSLSIDPAHAQTLFNMGIVKADGKQDYPGAVASWQALLAKHPAYPNAASVRSMIADAQRKAGVAN
jgi:predicted Zn-dependent protease